MNPSPQRNSPQFTRYGLGGEIVWGWPFGHSSTGISNCLNMSQLIMTSINFVSFLFSLVIVDLHYSYARTHSHAEPSGHLPRWLHHLLFRPQPYETTRVNTPGSYNHHKEQWHYHSNQRGLMAMEANEAFRIRNRVIIVLAVFVAVVGGALWQLAKRLYQRVYSCHLG